MDFSKTDYLQISKYQAQELLRFMQNVQNKEEIKRKYLMHEAAFFEGYFEELLRKAEECDKMRMWEEDEGLPQG